MSGSCQEALPEVQEWLEDPPGCPGVVGCPPGCPGVVGRPTRMSGSGRMPSRMSGSGRGPSRMSRNGQEALPDVREWLGGLSGCP